MTLIYNSLKNEIWKGLNRYFQKDAHQKSEGGSEVRFKKNLNPSPWKRRKTTSYAIFAQRAPEGYKLVTYALN